MSTNAILAAKLSDPALLEEVEQAFNNEWHEDQCHCSAYPEDCYTYPKTAENPYGWKRNAPDFHHTEEVLDKVIEILKSKSPA